MECAYCGGEAAVTKDNFLMDVKGEPILLCGIEHIKCLNPSCGEVTLSGKDAAEAQRQAVSEYKKKKGMLFASEIKSIRKSLKLTQQGLADELRVTQKSVARWERDAALHSAIQEKLMRELAAGEKIGCYITPDEKARFLQATAQAGTTPSEAIRVFIDAFIDTGEFPFDIPCTI